MKASVGAPRTAFDEAAATIAAGAGARLAGSALSMVAGLLTTLLAVRLLGSSEYGSLAIGLAMAGLVAVGARLGLGGAVTRQMAVARESSDAAAISRLSRGVVTLVAAGGIIAGLALVGATFLFVNRLPSDQRLSVGLGLALLLFGMNASAAAAFVARGLGRMGLMELPSLALVLAQLVAVSILWALEISSVTVLALSFGASGALATAAAAVVVRRSTANVPLWRPAPRAATALIRSAGAFALAGLAVQLIAQFDVVVLGVSHGARAVGEYEPALRAVDRMLLLVPALFTAGFIPAATAVFVRGDRGTFNDLFATTSKIAIVLSMPVLIGFAVFPEIALRVLYGADFPASTTIVRWLLVGYAANLAFGLNAGALVASGDRRGIVRAHLAAFVAMVVGALILIPTFGGPGAAAATSTAYVVLNGAVGLALHRATGARPFRRDHAIAVGTAVVPLAGAAMLGQMLGASSVAASCLVVLAVWVTWVAALIAAHVLTVAELRRLLGVGRRR